MKRSMQRNLTLAVMLMLAAAALGLAAPKSDRSSRYLTIDGQVLQVNRDARTLLVADLWSKKLYLVHVPKEESFQITFGVNMKTPEAGIRQVNRNDRVRMRCIRADKEHLARLDDGREAVNVTTAH